MGTISSAFSLISGALNADQAALNIVSSNVANANTPGYTREVPTWQENTPVMINGVAYGTGVTETGATSLRNRVLLERLDQQQQLASASSARLDALNNVQALFTPASGSASSIAGDIGSDITGFFSSFSSLEANPTDNALRQQVLSKASTLSADISGAAASLGQQTAAVDQETVGVVNQVNALTTSIAKLDQQIQSLSSGADAGALEDTRQQDLSQLSQLIGINQITTENNGLTIATTSGQTLISQGVSHALTTGAVNAMTHIFMGATDITAQLTTGGGQLGGYLNARDQDIPAVVGSLDQLAFGITTEVNALSISGIDLNGNPGTALFAQSNQVAGSAAGMRVTITNPSLVAAAAAGQGSGDNTNATALANLGSASSPAILNGQTPSNYFSSFVTTLGSTIAQVQAENIAQNASVSQLQTQNNSISSVNLNDEASALTTLERSYQAASQLFAIINTLMASALNLGSQANVA
jgi:flagellar hook-associated protein 1